MQDELSSGAAAARAGRWWQRPSVLSLFAVVLLLGSFLAWMLWRAPARLAEAPAETGLPWQIQPSADGGAEVFGLDLGSATLAEVQARFGDELRQGLIVPNGGEPALEAFVDGMRAGFVTGKLVLAFEADPDWMRQARERAVGNDVGEGGRSRRYQLAPADLEMARGSRLVALAFVPSVRLDADMVRQRFGEPAERVSAASGETQWLYPDRGLAVALPPDTGEAAKAKAVLQYVAPREFEARLRAPLRPAAAASGA